jgi:hypothetical protein
MTSLSMFKQRLWTLMTCFTHLAAPLWGACDHVLQYAMATYHPALLPNAVCFMFVWMQQAARGAMQNKGGGPLGGSLASTVCSKFLPPTQLVAAAQCPLTVRSSISRITQHTPHNNGTALRVAYTASLQRRVSKLVLCTTLTC